eukprot:SAG31_NODE_45690_length_257_cov_23.563291_1_plen_36_part_10
MSNTFRRQRGSTPRTNLGTGKFQLNLAACVQATNFL